MSYALESACLKQFNDHLIKMPALQKLQSAYNQDLSVETTVTKIYNDVIIDKNRGKYTTHVYLD